MPCILIFSLTEDGNIFQIVTKMYNAISGSDRTRIEQRGEERVKEAAKADSAKNQSFKRKASNKHKINKFDNIFDFYRAYKELVG